MRIQIGSRVKFLNDIGGGIVRSFRDDKLAVVETDDGFDMPVPVTGLILDESSSYGIDGEKTVPAKTVTAETSKDEKREYSFEEKKFASYKGEVLLAIVPQNDQLLHVSNFDLFLVNDSNYYCNFLVTLKDAAVSTLVDTGAIEPDTKLIVKTFSQTEISRIQEFRIQAQLFKYGLTEILAPIDMRFNIGNISFYKSQFFSDNEYFHNRAIILNKEEDPDLREAIEQLKASDLNKVARIKEAAPEKKKIKSPKDTVAEEVDLHIEEIVDSHAMLSNSEIINIQLDRFETSLETALRSSTQKIVFIHGVGNGKLRNELRKKLENNYPHLRYQDASFKEYGFGATMVFLK
jgi:hypothetical protein